MQIRLKYSKLTLPTLRSSTVFTLSAAIVPPIYKEFLRCTTHYSRIWNNVEMVFPGSSRCASPFLVSRNSCRADNIYAPLASRTVGKFLESFELILTAPRGLLDKRNPTVGPACADWLTHANLPGCCWTVLAGAWDQALVIGRNGDIVCAWRVECIIND
jgi:hypothetical protein